MLASAPLVEGTVGHETDECAMKQETFRVAVVDVGNVHIVRLSGELDIATVDGLTDRLIEIAGSTVVVDLAELSFMDSTGLSALVVAKNRMESDGDVLMLTRPRPNVRRVLEITGLADWVGEWSSEWSEPTDTDT
jgi:anti-sigma B factor antagonist